MFFQKQANLLSLYETLHSIVIVDLFATIHQSYIKRLPGNLAICDVFQHVNKTEDAIHQIHVNMQLNVIDNAVGG